MDQGSLLPPGRGLSTGGRTELSAKNQITRGRAFQSGQQLQQAAFAGTVRTDQGIETTWKEIESINRQLEDFPPVESDIAQREDRVHDYLCCSW